jgi:hypothetical protein
VAELKLKLDIERLTDEQLRAECERRPGLWASEVAKLSDGALRAEGNCRTVGFWYGPSAAQVLRELEVECAEWKRRATAAEAKLVEKMEIVDVVLDGSFLIPKNAIRKMQEGGPGIADLKPASEPLAHLDEDLLCADA